jgi:hypothetical protein
MSHLRLLTLTAGPVVLVAASYWLAAPGTVRGVDGTGGMRELAATTGPDVWPPEVKLPGVKLAAAEACGEVARGLAARLGPGCRVVVRPPYVLAGDAEEAALAATYDRLIEPIAACLGREFFARAPERPIAVVLCSGDAAYREFARRLDGRTSPLWYGYYQRNERRLVVNMSTGEGTLAHELVHALVHADCPGLPEWFDEGLASLYEQSRFSDDGRRLEGLSNWRLAALRSALDRGGVQPLARLAAPHSIRRAYEAVDYAHARYLCLYLQERGLLAAYYRRLRAGLESDPGGLRTLCEVLGAPADVIDRDFRRWVQTLR